MAMVEDTVNLTFAHPLFTASFSRRNSPVNQTNRLLMVSFLILLRSLRVNILKQLFTSGSVNIVEQSPRGSRGDYSTILTSPSANNC